MSDYYSILGVSKNASENEIKSAFRKLALQHHPDRGGNIEQFHKIQEAYETLSDPQKKSAYDNPQPRYQSSGFPGGFSFNFNGDLPDGFEAFFGNHSPFGAFSFGRRAPQNQNIQVATALSLEEAFSGKDIYATIQLPSGREQVINITIPPGIHDGTTLKLSGFGDDSIAAAPRGDILLQVRVDSHSIFQRNGDDLIQVVEITSIDAMLGKTIVVDTIHNKQLNTEIPAGIQNDAILSLAGYGMPNFNVPTNFGRLLLKIKIRTPTLTEEQKEQLRNLELQ